MEDKKEQRIFQVLPCYREDILALEAWLENMAAEGYMLKKFRWNGAVFVECEPVQVRYRFLPAPENKLINMGEPTERDKFIALYGQNGWVYVASYSSFYVFLCRKAELSEPERNLIAIMDKRIQNECSSMIMNTISILTAVLLLWYKAGLGMLLCITIGTLKYGALMVSALYFIYKALRDYNKLLNLRCTLKENTYEKQDAYSRDIMQIKNKQNYVVYLAFIVLLISSCVSAVAGLYSEPKEEPLRSYYESLPFPMISDNVPDGAIQIVDLQDSTIRQWSDILAPVAMEVTQYSDCAEVETGNVKVIESEFLEISYFETRTSWMAEQLAKDYQRFDASSRFGKEEKHAINFSELNMDYAVTYQSWYDTIVLAKNNKMMRICFYGYDYTTEEIAQIYAEYLLSEDIEKSDSVI